MSGVRYVASVSHSTIPDDQLTGGENGAGYPIANALQMRLPKTGGPSLNQ